MNRIVIAGLLCAAGSPALAEGSWRKLESGVIVTPDRGTARSVRLQVYGDQIVRVTEAPTRDPDVLASLMVNAVTSRDMPLLQACAMLFCAAYLLLVLTADVIAILANPRLRNG